MSVRGYYEMAMAWPTQKISFKTMSEYTSEHIQYSNDHRFINVKFVKSNILSG